MNYPVMSGYIKGSGRVSGENLFMKFVTPPLAPALPPWGAGAHCDASELPVEEISQ
jgi:hypothetical protein